MTPDPATFGPELEGLLREIAADPQSQLLRQRRPTTVAGLLERSGPVRSVRTGLTAAERHLVEVHRDELADVLRRACLMRFYSDPERSIFLNRSLDAHTQIPFDSPEQWRARARDALADARRCPAPLEGFDLLEACLCAAPDQRITITQLARASLLLQPTDVAEAYVGLDQSLGGRTADGVRIMQSSLEGSSRKVVRSCIEESLGHAMSTMGNLGEARDYYFSASRSDESRPSASVGLLLLAIQCEDQRTASGAAQRIDEFGEEAKAVVMDLVAKYQSQIGDGSLVVCKGAAQLARRLHGGLGMLSREVAHVLLG